MNLEASYPVVKIEVEGMPVKDFFDYRIRELEKALLTCDSRITHIIESSLQVNRNIRSSLGKF